MIDEQQVRQIARLARLALSEEEIRLQQRQLAKILQVMEELRRLDTTGVVPTSHVLGLTDVMRKDEVRPFAHKDELLDAAPMRHGPYFKVPKVLE